MTYFKRTMVMLILSALLITGVRAPVLAQDNIRTVNCDSDLILLWYIAERYFGFATVQSSLSGAAIDPSTALNLDTFNLGQFGALFDSLHNAQSAGAVTVFTPDQDFLNAALATMLMDDAGFQNMVNSMQAAGTDVSTITALNPATVTGEPAECGRLRGQLQRFFAAVAVSDISGGFNLAFGLNGNVNANVNTNANVNDNGNVNANANDNVDDNSNANVNTNDNTDDNSNGNVNTNDNTDDNGNANDNTDDNGNANDNTDDNSNANVNTNDNTDDNGGGDNSGSGNGGGNDDNSGSGNSGGDDNGGSGNSGSGGNGG